MRSGLFLIIAWMRRISLSSSSVAPDSAEDMMNANRLLINYLLRWMDLKQTLK